MLHGIVSSLVEAEERHPGSTKTAGPDSVNFQPGYRSLAAYPHIAIPTLDLTDDEDLKIVDVGSGPDFEVNLSYQKLLTSDTKPDFDLPTEVVRIPLTGSILDIGTDGP